VTRSLGTRVAIAALVVVTSACGADPITSARPPASPSLASSPSASAEPSTSAPVGEVEPPPGSDSALYAPNPGAILVAIDAGHGGCLDWGVPDPSERGVELAEKTLTLAIAERLRARLEADGIGVLMIREGDEALAGDDYPELGCEGPAWRDVDGDGRAGFEETGRVRTRDELQARIDRANLAGADAFVSIHINSLTQDGVVFELAATQTFYDDETPWGADGSARLASGLQDGVVAGIDRLATYERQDRGTEAVAYYAISRAWDAAADTCETEGDTYCKPHRGLAMPSALAEVGSITLRDEHDLLATTRGQEAIADGLFSGIGAFLAGRPVAARIALPGEPVAGPTMAPGEGPPFVARQLPAGPLTLRVTNTGTDHMAAGARIVAGWEASAAPYLAAAPPDAAPIGPALPALEPGASVTIDVELPPVPDAARALAWISLMTDAGTLADLGSPALQLATAAP
jgi:N-acetylmuramoyl-L-alanine amidase